MTKPQYFAIRKGHTLDNLSFDEMARLISEACVAYEEDGWFQSRLGKDCVDKPRDIGAQALEHIGQDIWPLERLRGLDEDWLLTAVEFLYRNAAMPINSYIHDWNQCGVHVTSADAKAGREQFHERMNNILSRYETPYELRVDGEIWELAPSGLEELHIDATGDEKIDTRVQKACSLFRRHGATDDDKRQAVRDLADVLEYLRSSLKTALPTKDEGYLFDIANNYGIRHHNDKQKTDYNQGIYMEWIFYAYLNAIALVVKLNRA